MTNGVRKLAASVIVHLFLLVISSVECQSDEADRQFYPSENDEDYNFPTYPFQQYIQVRKSVSVEHVPLYSSGKNEQNAEGVAGSGNLEKAASTNPESSSSSSSPTPSDTYGGDQEYYYKPPLKEEIFLHKKQEVYEERGYHDGHYDHYAERGQGSDSHPEYQSSDHQPASTKSSDRLTTAATGGRKRYAKRPVGADDASSTRVLEHIANNLYDRDGHAVGFYKARSHIQCPEIIDFNLSSKSHKMGQGLRPKGKPRLSGLGSKIDCLKRKYWGQEILPSSVFMEPSESRQSEIKFGTMDDFLKDIRQSFYGHK